MTIARSTAAGLVASLVAALVLSFGFAQETTAEDDVLQRYRLAIDSLDAAVSVVASDAVEARSSLDRAFSALLTLSRGDAGALTESLERVFERARTSIDNRSETDFAVQAHVLIGGFQRLLFESALVAAVEGNDGLARERLLALAGDVDLGTARSEQLASETEPGPLRRIFEAGIAEQVAARLDGLAEAGAPEDRDVAYRQLARAYADFLLVQDSGRLEPEANRRFVSAAQALVDEDDEAYLASLSALTSDLADLREAADAGTPPREDATEGVVADLDGTAEDAAASEPQADAADGAQDATAADAASDAAGEGEAGESDLAVLREEIEAEVRERLEAERAEAAIAALAAELTALGVVAPARDELAADLHGAGVTSVASLEAQVARLAATFQTDVLRGDVVAARATLDDLERTYGPRQSAVGGADLASLAFRLAPEADGRLRATIDRLQSAPTLRSADASLLVAEVMSLSDALRQQPVPVLQQTIDSTSTWWAGWIRPVAMIVLALLALIPLRLVRLAFGGGNPNWSQVGFALFLLLLPIYVEGVVAAAGLLADPLDMPSLASWGVASIFASELTQFIWTVVMAFAVLVAIAGFYGICVQFGVLGRRRSSARSSAPRSQRGPSTTEDETLVDWDDEAF